MEEQDEKQDEEQEEKQDKKEIKEIDNEEEELSFEKRIYEKEEETENLFHYTQLKKLDEMYDVTTSSDNQLREVIEERRDLIEHFFQKRRYFSEEYEVEIRKKRRGLKDRREGILNRREKRREK